MIIIIGGATATGKTAVASMVAKKINGELISADSMQIYKNMNIGTAKETAEDLGVAEYLVDIVSPDAAFSVVDYRNNALIAIKDIENRGKVPIIVGGTGFYISSLVYKMEYGGENNSINTEIKNRLLSELALENGKEKLHELLQQLDPISAKKIHCNNTKRLIRALEVTISTNKPFSEQNIKDTTSIIPCSMFSLLSQNRENLRQRIVDRVEKMFNLGLQAEVEQLLANGINFDMQSMQGIGYKEWRPYFAGNATIDSVKQQIIKNTNAFAKRQETWFKNQYNFSVNLNMEDGAEKLANIITSSIIK